MIPTSSLRQVRHGLPYLREQELTLLSGPTEADIRLQLAEQDNKEAAEGKFSLHKMSPASMLGELLDIEDQQYVLLY